MVNIESFLITTDYVREALDQMIQVSQATITPLQFLHLIDMHMLTADFSFFQEPRLFALNDLLISTIHGEYLFQRHSHDFSSVITGITLTNAIQLIKEDATTSNSDLIGWSWLYYHYVETSLRITQQDFCQIVNLDNRTIRRYQMTTIDQLTKRLIRLEQNVRSVRRKQLLYLQLPHQNTDLNLVEREKEIQLIRNSSRTHIFIIGSAGIGKTVLVENVIKEQIESDSLDHIIWISSPKSIKEVELVLRERLLNENSGVAIGEFLAIKKVVIVLDNIEALQKDLVELEGFLLSLSNAQLFLTSRHFIPIPHCLHIHLCELSINAVQIIVAAGKLPHDGDPLPGDDPTIIYRSVGGNTLAVELLTQNLSIFDLEAAASLTLDQLLGELFERIAPSTRLAWILLALIDNGSITFPNLQEMQSSFVQFQDFVTLSRLSIVKGMNTTNSNIVLSVSARQFVQIRYITDEELKNSLNDLIAELLSNGANMSQARLVLIESLLSVEWVNLNIQIAQDLAQLFWQDGLRHGHYTQWYVIIAKLVNELTPQNLELAIGSGISLRNLGQWSAANTIFAAVIQYAGMEGLFPIQAEALIELATLLRYQGDFAATLVVLNRIETLMNTLRPQLRNRVTIEQIEYALALGRLGEARAILSKVSHNEVYRHIYQLEILARDREYLGELPFWVSLGEKLLVDVSYNPSQIARIHNLLGRVYETLSDIEMAIKHVTIAQSILLNVDNDPFALARTQSNLASLFLVCDQLTNAHDLLESAANIQRQIGDRVGLAVTMHNELVLSRKIVS